jgi:hypothetical protein
MESRVLGRCAWLSIVTLAIGGCGLASPYLRMPSPEERSRYCSDARCSIDHAIEYSQTVRATYRATLDKYSRLRSNTGAATIAIGAAALGFGVVEAHRDVFTTLGFIGATDYAYSKWYENPPREELFRQSIDALVCAESATDKLRLPMATRRQLDVLDDRVVEALNALANVSSQLAGTLTDLNTMRIDVDHRIEQVAEGDKVHAVQLDLLRRRIATEIEAIQVILDATVDARAHADAGRLAKALRIQIVESAGYRLMTTVDRIVVATDREAAKTIPDPASAFSIVGDLGTLSTRFIPNAAAIKALNDAATSAMQAESDELVGPAADSVLSELNRILVGVPALRHTASRLMAQLAGDVALMAGLSGPSAGSDPYAPLDRCTIAGLAGLSASPSAIEALELTASVIAVDIDGGKSPYSAEVNGSVPTGLSLTNPRIGESRVVITLTDKIAVGIYNIRVTDANRRQLNIVLTVKRKPPATAAVATHEAQRQSSSNVGSGSDTADGDSPLQGLVGRKVSVLGTEFTVTAIAIDDEAVSVTIKPEPTPDQRNELPSALARLSVGAGTVNDLLGMRVLRLAA